MGPRPKNLRRTIASLSRSTPAEGSPALHEPFENRILGFRVEPLSRSRTTSLRNKRKIRHGLGRPKSFKNGLGQPGKVAGTYGLIATHKQSIWKAAR